MEVQVPGGQAAQRVLEMLKVLGTCHVDGASLTDISARSRLTLPTASRLIAVLVASGLAHRNPASRRYHLGMQAMRLGLAAMARPPALDMVRPVLALLARMTGDTVFLILRHGDFGHCLHVEHGENVIASHALMLGQMRLLGLGTGCLAIAASLSDHELQVTHSRRQLDYVDAGMDWPRLRKMVEQTRKRGYALSHSLLTVGASGVGMPVALGGGLAAISVASATERMTAARQAAVAGTLMQQIRRAGLQLGDAPWVAV